MVGSGALAGSFGQALTFTRATTKTVETSGANATIATLSSGQPGVGIKGLSVEAAATNLCLRSSEFDSATWGKSHNGAALPVVTANAVVAPDGTTTADQIAYPAVSGAGNYAEVYQQIAMTAVAYVSSVWLKTASGTATLYLSSTTDGVTWKRTTCNVTATWQRFELTGTYTATNWFHMLSIDRRDASQADQIAQTVLAWGFQVELGSAASSYIATAGTQATRNADAVTIASSGSWPVASGELRCTFSTLGGMAENRGILDARADANNGWTLYTNATGQLSFLTGDDSSTGESTSTGLTWTAGQLYRLRVVWTAAGAHSVYRDDVLVASGTGKPVPGAINANVSIGQLLGGTSRMQGHLHSLEVRK